MRTGIGYDVHPFEAGRVLVLGGVKIEGSWGLKGHSDADPLLHAIADAILGAAALGDLGDHFPDTDPRWKDVPSAVILSEVVAMAARAGLRPSQVDATVVAERPRIAGHRAAMRERIASLLGIDVGRVSVKATTNNGVGTLGRGDAVAAFAVVTMEEVPA